MASADTERSLRAMGAEIRFTESWHERWTELERGVREQGWYPVSNYRVPPVSSQPVGVRAYRSLAYEIAEQRDWSVPDWIAVPVSRGDALCAMVAGFDEIRELGWISRLPRMLAVVRFPSLQEAVRSGREQPLASEYPKPGRQCPSAIPRQRLLPHGQFVTAGAMSLSSATTIWQKRRPTPPLTAGWSSSLPRLRWPARSNSGSVGTRATSSPWSRRVSLTGRPTGSHGRIRVGGWIGVIPRDRATRRFPDTPAWSSAYPHRAYNTGMARRAIRGYVTRVRGRRGQPPRLCAIRAASQHPSVPTGCL